MFPLPAKGHLTSYGIGLFSTDSHIGFEADEGKRFYFDLRPVPAKLKEKGIVDADSIGVFALFNEEDDFLVRGEVLDADVNYTIFPETDEVPSSLFLKPETGKRVFISWDRKGYKVTELD